MADLTPAPTWSGVYQIETTDDVKGGAGGIANSQAQALANRDEFIREAILDPLTGDAIAAKLYDEDGQTQQQINDIEKAYSGAHPFSAQPSGYAVNSRVSRSDGVVVQSIIEGNTADPNTSMAGWRGFISGRRYIDVADYVPSNDALDVYAGVAAAFAAAQGREIVFTKPHGGTRTYRFLNRTDGGIVVPAGARVICEGGTKLDFSAWTRSGSRKTMFRVGGTQEATTHALASDSLQGTRVLTLATGAGASYNVGDYILISSNAVFGFYSYDTQGEFAQIMAKSGDNLTLHEAFHANYLVADSAYIRKINFADKTIFEGMTITGPGRFSDESNGDYGIFAELVNGLEVEGSTINNVDFNAIHLNRCINFNVSDFEVSHELATNLAIGAQYGVAIVGGCMYGKIRNGVSRNGRHCVAWSDSGAAGYGVSRYVDIVGATGVGQNSASFITHTNNEHCRILDCNSTGSAGGADIRVPNMIVDNLKVRNLRAESNLQIGVILRLLARDVTINKLNMRGGRYGVSTITGEDLSNASNIEITNGRFYSQSQRAIGLENSTAAAPVHGLKITDNYIESASAATIRSVVAYKNPNIRDNVIRATSGAVSGSSAIQLLNCDSVIAIDNTAIGYGGSVLIQSSTGTHINRGNDVLVL